MKRFLVVATLVVVVAAAWRISERLSADALAMGTGLMFGVLAGVPTALLVLASRRRRDEYDDYDADGYDDGGRVAGYARHGRPHALPHLPQQAPVIVLAAPPAYGAQSPQPGFAETWDRAPAPLALPGPRVVDGSSRSFKIVGEQEEWIEEF